MDCDGYPLTSLCGPFLIDLEREKYHSRRLAVQIIRKGKALVETFSPGEVSVYATDQEHIMKIYKVPCSFWYFGTLRPVLTFLQLT